MKNLTSHFFIYLSTILLLVVGTTNYWLYNNNTERLNNSFDSAAHNQLESTTSLSAYYITHYEYELLNKLIEDTAMQKGTIYASLTSIDGYINVRSGTYTATNSRLYSKKIIHDNFHLGTVDIAVDDSLLKTELNQVLINSIFLVIITISLISGLVISFFRSRVMKTVKHAHSEKELAHKEKDFLSVIMNSSSSLVIVLESNGTIVLTNNTCNSYIQKDSISSEGKPIWDYFSIKCEGILIKDLFNTNKNKLNVKNLNQLKNNKCISICELNNKQAIIEWSFNVLQDDDADTHLLIATGVDETAQHLESEKLSYLAMHDPLTGLPNRSLFMDHLETALAQYKRNHDKFCLLYLDLDKFKPINDSLGHDAGDFILKEIAETLQNNLRAVDTAARLGGDEFGIILTGINSRDNAAKVAQKCIEAISQPFTYLSHQLQLGVSIGIAYYPDHKCDIEQLITYADIAMYNVKNSGRNSYLFYDKNNQDTNQ